MVHALAWALILSLTSGFLRPSFRELAYQYHAIFVLIYPFKVLERKYLKVAPDTDLGEKEMKKTRNIMFSLLFVFIGIDFLSCTKEQQHEESYYWSEQYQLLLGKWKCTSGNVEWIKGSTWEFKSGGIVLIKGTNEYGSYSYYDLYNFCESDNLIVFDGGDDPFIITELTQSTMKWKGVGDEAGSNIVWSKIN